MHILRTIILVTSALLHTNLIAQEYVLSIQPMLSKDKVVKTYQPLADYLTEKTGHQISIKAYKNFYSYWHKMRAGNDFDFVLDAAHFTDYRIQNQGYMALAKIPDTVSLSLVAHKNLSVTTPNDLTRKCIASTPSPSLSGIQLYEIFNNPSRLPREISVKSSQEAINAIAEGKADAAIIPSLLVKKYDFLNTVTTTKKIPDMAISASPTVPLDVKQSIQQALIDASQSEKGKLMLEKISFPSFVTTNNKEYSGYSNLLINVFGYQASVSGDGNK